MVQKAQIFLYIIKNTAITLKCVFCTDSTMFSKFHGSGSYQSFDMRCIVTGQNASGKSSLVKLLVGDNFPERQHQIHGRAFVEGRCGLELETKSWTEIDPGKDKYLHTVIYLCSYDLFIMYIY